MSGKEVKMSYVQNVRRWRQCCWCCWWRWMLSSSHPGLSNVTSVQNVLMTQMNGPIVRETYASQNMVC